MSEIYLTRAGYDKLLAELEALKKQKADLSREIGEAAEKGDLKENSEYHAAKERQTDTLRRIHEIDDKLKRARLIEELDIPEGVVQIGVRVTLVECDSREESEWTLVGPEEADPGCGRLSVYSPLAQGILGSKVGSEVTVTLPVGPRKFKIVKTRLLGKRGD